MAEPYVGIERMAGPSWPGIFAGTFVFLAIELTFGLLGVAIFAAPNGVWTPGAGVWLIVLSIISMFFGAKAAAHWANLPRKLNGVYHGLATFGVSSFAVIIIAALSLMTTFEGHAAGAAASQAAPTTIMGMASTLGWWLFGAFCGAFIAAIVGGASAVRRTMAPVAQVPGQRVA